MKTKVRLLFIGAAIFVIYVSYKILEPELLRYKNAYKSKWMSTEGQNADEAEPRTVATSNSSFNREMNGSEITKQQIIQTMIENYKPNFFYPLEESPWDIAAKWVEARQIYPDNAKELGAILKAMSQGTITSADFGQRGTQLKLTLLIDNAQKVVFKPAWYPRDYVVTGTPYSGRDRHNGEIAAFYLGSLLGLRRIPLVIGRRIHFEKEILPVSTSRLITTFFEKDGESCFYGRCRYCMGPEDGVCTTNGVIEGTIVLWMPSQFKLTLHKHPWSRTYREGVQAKWETDDHYCDKVKSSPYYSTGHRLLDIIDTCIFDYLIGNADRHHYETFEGYEDSMLIMLDNGKSFGNPDIDEFSILAPLYQCCQIRVTLWEKLLAMKDGILSQVLAGILSVDPITPILTQKHLDALDRRLKTVLEQIHACIAEVGTHALVFESSIR
ncbi:glycosaminoglycan xylosylkinase-like [Biomphalaria glabrata]|uniref:Glycosaminoglycan xylosylkinase-like n=1 Tax=Biomphalaria glabrata TaxID=6526 RepID=A0A9W3B9N9_BIOGL|nr:glycosaminoglycan xylosylkinase-like [Biomphalaria glabrata]